MDTLKDISNKIILDVEMNQAELAVRMMERIGGTTRPSITAEQTLEITDPEIRAQYLALSSVALSYMMERIRAIYIERDKSETIN